MNPFKDSNTAKMLKVIDALAQERETLRGEGNNAAADAIDRFLGEAQPDSFMRLYQIIVAS